MFVNCLPSALPGDRSARSKIALLSFGRPGSGFVRHKGPGEGGRETEKAREDDLQRLILSTLAVVIVIGLGDGSPWEPSSITRRQAEFCPSLQATREPRQTVPRKTPGRPLTGPSNGPRWRLLRTPWTAAGTYRVTEAWLEDGVVEPLRGKETKGHLMLMQDSIDLSGTFLAYSVRFSQGQRGRWISICFRTPGSHTAIRRTYIHDDNDTGAPHASFLRRQQNTAPPAAQGQ